MSARSRVDVQRVPVFADRTAPPTVFGAPLTVFGVPPTVFGVPPTVFGVSPTVFGAPPQFSERLPQFSERPILMWETAIVVDIDTDTDIC